jgi:hypothetical protein
MGGSGSGSRGPVFIVGLGRSGTSLTRSLINGHPGFAVAPEIHFLDHWMPRFRRVDPARDFDVFWSSFVAGKHFPRLQIDAGETRAAILAQGAPSWMETYRTLLIRHAGARGRSRWGEKTPVYFRHLSQLLGWFPDACIVFLVRDPRGVAASHQVVDTDWADPDPAHVAKSWVQSVRIMQSWASDPRVRLVRYEDIVAAPTDTLRELFHFLGEDFDPDVLERRHQVGALRENGSLTPGAPVSAAHVDKWRERLSSRDVSIVEHIAGGMMECHDYQRVSTGPGMRTLTQVQIMSARRNAVRATRALKEPRKAMHRVSSRVRRRVSDRGKPG